jgi:L-lactate dehydrogenase complex protein LldG
MDLQTRFMERAVALGANAATCSRSALCDAVDERAAGSASIGVSEELLAAVPELASSRRGQADHPEIGVVLGLAGVASLGSVYVASRRRDDRTLWLLAERQIVVLPVSSLVPALPDAGPLVRDWIADGRAFITQVAGPSRTSDIERVLTIGVHGPGRVDILLLTDAGDAGE